MAALTTDQPCDKLIPANGRLSGRQALLQPTVDSLGIRERRDRFTRRKRPFHSLENASIRPTGARFTVSVSVTSLRPSGPEVQVAGPALVPGGWLASRGHLGQLTHLLRAQLQHGGQHGQQARALVALLERHELDDDVLEVLHLVEVLLALL